MQNDVRQELSTNFINYAAAVNSDRAIPDATSGLKPVARRILYGAYDGGRLSSKPHVKCARIVGDVMGNLHPHGDSSIYGALVRLAQDWVMRYPLIDFHGNVGNIGGDGPAASRYTEARLSKLSEDGLLTGLKKKNVDFVPNYDETMEEPVTLPAIFPNLLCNPNTGIGVAMACNWASHNLNEVAQAIYDYMDDKEPMLPGPDFPTGGLIINKDDIPTIMRTGHGSVIVRGQYKIEKQNIVFYEIPYGTATEALIAEIGELSDKKEIEGISNINDESTIKGLRIVIECERGYSPESIVKQLFIKSNLQTTFSYNQVALVDKTPMELNLKDAIKIYIEHNNKCIIREALFDIKKATERLHIIIGLLKALDEIDRIIEMIKTSASAAAAKATLITWGYSEAQAKAILDMKLSRLAKMEKEDLEKEQDELKALLIKLQEICENPSTELRKRLQALVAKYGDKRRTELAQIAVAKEDKEIEEVIPEDVVVVLAQDGAIKRIPANSFKIQKKNGKGVKTANEVILESISTNTIDTLMLFSNKGKMFRMVVDKVPTGTNLTKGININTIINMEPNEQIIAMTSLYRQSTAKYVVFFTNKGLIKKTLLEEYIKTKKTTGIQAIKLADDDGIANVTFINDEDVIVISNNGMAIHFETKPIAAIGRVAQGVKAINLAEGDSVLCGLPIHNYNDMIAIAAFNGYGKRVEISAFPVQGRGGKGIKCSTSNIVGAAMVSNNDTLLLLGKPNSICISASELPILSRISIGNSLIKNSSIVRMVKI